MNLSISDGRRAFFQWDTNQRLIVDFPVASQVHFSSSNSDQALVVEIKEEGGIYYCEVPNILLQEDNPIRCYVSVTLPGEGRVTIHESVFKVIPRNKPCDYVYTETEILSYEKWNEKLNNIISDYNTMSFITNEDILNILNN